jgi:hypothetical protein
MTPNLSGSFMGRAAALNRQTFNLSVSSIGTTSVPCTFLRHKLLPKPAPPQVKRLPPSFPTANRAMFLYCFFPFIMPHPISHHGSPILPLTSVKLSLGMRDWGPGFHPQHHKQTKIYQIHPYLPSCHNRSIVRGKQSFWPQSDSHNLGFVGHTQSMCVKLLNSAVWGTKASRGYKNKWTWAGSNMLYLQTWKLLSFT